TGRETDGQALMSARASVAKHAHSGSFLLPQWIIRSESDRGRGDFTHAARHGTRGVRYGRGCQDEDKHDYEWDEPCSEAPHCFVHVTIPILCNGSLNSGITISKDHVPSLYSTSALSVPTGMSSK